MQRTRMPDPEDFPVLKTERLVLDYVKHTDIKAIVELAGNPKIAETTLNIPSSYTTNDAIQWINGVHEGRKNKTEFTFVIRKRKDEIFTGAITIKVNEKFNHGEIGYWIGVPYWNQGYATEAVRKVIRFCFDCLNLHKVFATYLPHNEASGKVMRKNGMIREGVWKDHIKKGVHYYDLIQYRLTREEFEIVRRLSGNKDGKSPK